MRGQKPLSKKKKNKIYNQIIERTYKKCLTKICRIVIYTAMSSGDCRVVWQDIAILCNISAWISTFYTHSSLITDRERIYRYGFLATVFQLRGKKWHQNLRHPLLQILQRQ